MNLRRVAEALTEAFALASAALVPLSLNPHSSRVFDGDKACLLYLFATGSALSFGLLVLLSPDWPRMIRERLRGTARETPVLGFAAASLAGGEESP